MNRKSTVGGGMSRVGTSVYGSSAAGGGGNNTAATSSHPNPNFQLNFDSLNATRAGAAPLVFQDPFHVSEESVVDSFSTATAGEEVAVQIMHEVFRNACDSMANRHLERLARPYAVQSITHELLDIIRSTFVGRDSGAIRPAGWTMLSEEYDKPKRTTVDSGSRGLVEAKPMMSAATRQLMEERGLLAVATPPASSHGGGRGALRATPSNGDFLSVSRSSTSFAANNNNNLAATTSSASFSRSPSAANLANTRSNANKNSKTNNSNNNNLSPSPDGNSASPGSPQNPQRERRVGGVSGPTVSQLRATAAQRDALGDHNTGTNNAGREGGGRKKEGPGRVGEKSPTRRGEELNASSSAAISEATGGSDHIDKYGAPRPQRQQQQQHDFEQHEQHQQERDANEAEFLRSLNETKARQAKLRETREKVSAQLNQVLGGGGGTRSNASPMAGGSGGAANNTITATSSLLSGGLINHHGLSGAGGGPEFVIDGITNQVIRVQKVPPLPSPGGGGAAQKKRHQLGGEGEDDDGYEDTDGPSADQHQQSTASLRRGAARQQQQQTTQAPLPTRGTAGGIAFSIASKSVAATTSALNPPNISNSGAIDDQQQQQQQRAASHSPAKRRGGEKRNITDLSTGASLINGLEDKTGIVGVGAEPTVAIMSKSAVKKSTATRSTLSNQRAPALSNSTHGNGTMSGSNDPLSDYVKIDAPDASNKMRIRVSAAAGVATAGDSGQSSSNWSSPQGKPTHAEFVSMRETDRNALGSEKVILERGGKRAHGGVAIDDGTEGGEEDNYYHSYSNTNNHVYPTATTPRSGGGATDPIAPSHAAVSGLSSPQQQQLLFGNASYSANNTTTNTKSLLLSSTPNSRIQKTLSEARAIVAAAGGGAHDGVLGEGPLFATSANRNANIITTVNPPHRVAAMGASANGVLLGNGAVSNSNSSSSAPPSAATANGQRLASSVGSIPVVRR